MQSTRAVVEMGVDRRVWLVVGVIALLGLAARVAYFAADTALWGDEAAVALNLASRSAGQLAQPLDHGQQAPFFFLLVEKVIFDLAGLNEHALRLPAFLSTLAALPLFALVTWRLAGPAVAAAGSVLFALSPGLVRYGAELKPYAVDVLATLIVLWLAHRVIRMDFRRSRLAAFAAAGAILIWFSYPVVFVLAGVGSTLLIDRLLHRRRADAAAMAAAACAWVTSALLVYALVRRSPTLPYLVSFWDYAFVAFPPRSLWDVRHAVEIFFAIFVNPIGLAGAGIGAAFFLLGGAAFIARDWRLVGFCTGPLLVTFAAAALHAYPFATRLMLFSVPLVLLQVAAGIVSVTPAPLRHWAPMLLTVVMAAGPAMGTRDVLGEPERSGVRDVLESLKTQVADGDVVYVYYKSQSAVELYRGPVAEAVRGITWMNGSLDVREGTHVAEDLRKLSGHPRVWFLFSEVHTFFVDEERLMLTAIERVAQRRAQISSGPARAYLYESASGRWTGD